MKTLIIIIAISLSGVISLLLCKRYIYREMESSAYYRAVRGNLKVIASTTIVPMIFSLIFVLYNSTSKMSYVFIGGLGLLCSFIINHCSIKRASVGNLGKLNHPKSYIILYKLIFIVRFFILYTISILLIHVLV